jgi:hypothetical protein
VSGRLCGASPERTSLREEVASHPAALPLPRDRDRDPTARTPVGATPEVSTQAGLRLLPFSSYSSGPFIFKSASCDARGLLPAAPAWPPAKFSFSFLNSMRKPCLSFFRRFSSALTSSSSFLDRFFFDDPFSRKAAFP